MAECIELEMIPEFHGGLLLTVVGSSSLARGSILVDDCAQVSCAREES